MAINGPGSISATTWSFATSPNNSPSILTRRPSVRLTASARTAWTSPTAFGRPTWRPQSQKVPAPAATKTISGSN